jgi:Fe-S-cluster containining protein
MRHKNRPELLIGGLQADRKIPFVCLGSDCPSSCCGPFHGTRALQAVLSIDDLGPTLGEPRPSSDHTSIFAQIRLTPEDVARLQRAGLDRLMVYRGEQSRPAYYLRLKEDGTCAALTSKGVCSIHPDRPTICRAFPFYLDLFAGLAMVEACPGVGAGEQPLHDLAEEVNAAVKMYKFWINVLTANDDEV